MGGTDHVSFLNKGVPTTYIWTDWTYRPATNPPEWGGETVYIAGNPYYHTSGDTVENTILREPWNMLLIARMAALLAARVVDFNQVIGFLPPLEAGGTYNAGSTIPVRFQLKNAVGDYVADAVAEIYIDDNPGQSSGSSNTLNFFRYDPESSQYIFNLDTKGMSAGSHTIEVRLANGETILATTIELR
jgi:Zn-dependent M28 family amino/carboxypeptidase